MRPKSSSSPLLAESVKHLFKTPPTLLRGITRISDTFAASAKTKRNYLYASDALKSEKDI